MAVGTLTFTGKIGTGTTITSAVFRNVSNLVFDLAAAVIRITADPNQKITEVDYDPEATVTYTISGKTATITIST